MEGTRLNAGATKTMLVAEIHATRYFTDSSAGVRELRSGFVRVQLAANVQRQKEDDAMTGAAVSRRSRGQSQRVPILFAMAGT
jgi:hypothetical protein